MADITTKRVSELPAAESVGQTDLFVVEQDGVAKSVSGSLMISSFGESVDDALSSTSENPVQNKVIKAALDNKVDKVSGKGLSTNDYTTTEKNKVAGIEVGAQKNIKITVGGDDLDVESAEMMSYSGISGLCLNTSDGNAVFLPDLSGFQAGSARILAQVHSIPAGGTTGQFLVKSSGTDYDAAWVTVPNANGVSF